MPNAHTTRWEDILHVAQLAVMEAGDHALKQFMRVHVLKEKPMTTDEVTSVDLENEKRIIRILRKNFPGHTILSEERKLSDSRRGDVWWVDPLDGSVSYFFGLPFWSVTLCLIHGQEPRVGVIYFPQTRDLYWAMKDKGAFVNYQKMSVSTIRSLKGGVIGIDYGYAKEREEGVKAVTEKLIDRVKYAVTYACVSGSDVLVAEGKLTAHIHHMARRFDHAAGALLVKEAGGMVSDTEGRAIDWRDTNPVHLVLTNGKVHREILKLLHT